MYGRTPAFDTEFRKKNEQDANVLEYFVCLPSVLCFNNDIESVLECAQQIYATSYWLLADLGMFLFHPLLIAGV